MGPSILFFFLFWVFFFQTSIDAYSPASTSKCSNGGPEIRHPFHIKKSQQPHQPNYKYEVSSGFEIICKNNLTILEFPSYGDLVVKSISYDTKRFDLYDPKNCTHHVFLNLDLSLTPFRFYYVLKNYTFLNCSDSLFPPFMEVPCLSGSNHHVYTVDPNSVFVTRFCAVVKTVAIPFEYSPYLSDNSLGLGLTWDLSQSQEIIPRNSQTARYTGKFFTFFRYHIYCYSSIY